MTKISVNWVALITSFAAFSAGAQSSINTITDRNGCQNAGYFGLGWTSTFGQVITVPDSEDILSGFSFAINLPATDYFQAGVYAWNGTGATGPALYTSPATATSGSGTFETMAFDTGGISVTPGGSYVLMATTVDEGGSGEGTWGLVVPSDYPAGGFVYAGNTTPDELTSEPWYTVYESGSSLAFTADFAPVPEPSSWGLLGLGVIAWTGWRRRE